MCIRYQGLTIFSKNIYQPIYASFQKQYVWNFCLVVDYSFFFTEFWNIKNHLVRFKYGY